MYSSTAFAYHLLISLRLALLELHLLNLLYLGTLLTFLIHSSVVQNTILDSSIDNLTVNDSLTGQIGGGEETLATGSGSFLGEVISMPSVLACGATTTVQPKVGHDITFVKYQEVQITGDADLIWVEPQIL